uniref:Uncharacterized protein n=1 Tax=Anguilla anguilla TaxID=7936 RepID=A0A0E9XFK5_ANGAN
MLGVPASQKAPEGFHKLAGSVHTSSQHFCHRYHVFCTPHCNVN